MKKTKIYVCAHKKDISIKSNDIYTPIHVGKALSNENLNFIGDDTGDNISEKNKKYCELTALYWVWKNVKHIDIVGFAHYRRYFDINISTENIEKILRANDIILLKPAVLNFSVGQEFVRLVTLEDFYILMDVLLKQVPSYRESIINYFFRSNKWIRCNMFITDFDKFSEYCNFLFPILFEIESRIKEYNYYRLNRNLGYIGELLLGLYCYHNKLKAKYVAPLEFVDYKISPIMGSISDLRKNISFKIVKGFRKQNNIPVYDSVMTGFRIDGINLEYLNKYK